MAGGIHYYYFKLRNIELIIYVLYLFDQCVVKHHSEGLTKDIKAQKSLQRSYFLFNPVIIFVNKSFISRENVRCPSRDVRAPPADRTTLTSSGPLRNPEISQDTNRWAGRDV